jgi:hypothetical protein
MDAQLYLQITTGRSGLRASLNGIDLFDDPGADGRDPFTARIPLDHWLLPQGGNEVTFEVTPAPGQDAPVVLAVVYAEDYKDPVVELQWSAPAGGEVAPFKATFPFQVPVAITSKLWLEATPLGPDVFDEKARAEAIYAGFAWYAAFAEKDVEKIALLAEYRARDLAAAYAELSPEGGIDDYARAVGRPKFVLEPLTRESVELRLVAGNRAVQLTRGQSPWIKALPEKYWPDVTMPLCVALVDGKWVVAR